MANKNISGRQNLAGQSSDLDILHDGRMAAFDSQAVVWQNDQHLYLDDQVMAPAVEGPVLSAVVDIGSTTLAVSLVDNQSGREIAATTGLNPQRPYGEDVLSRTSYIIEHDQGLDRLQSLIIDQLQDLILALLDEHGYGPGDLYAIYIAANAIMNHILLGLSPEPLGRSPYRLHFKGKKVVDFQDLALDVFGLGKLVVLPNITAFVGGDVTAGIVATDIYQKEATELFIDIGTNGELILTHQGQLYATSCAAGPALEGMGIACGVTAQVGAIEEADFDPASHSLAIRTIGQQAPMGLCGSGVLAVIREFLKAGLINPRGNIVKKEKIDPALHHFYVDGQKALWVDRPAAIYLSQKDIRQLQMAKGAILTGVLSLLDFAGVGVDQVSTVYIAGQFGKHLSADSLTQVGLLPQAFHPIIEYVGNTSKSGCFMVAMNRPLYQRVDDLVSHIKFLPLTLVEDFDLRLAKATAFPSAEA